MGSPCHFSPVTPSCKGDPFAHSNDEVNTYFQFVHLFSCCVDGRDDFQAPPMLAWKPKEVLNLEFYLSGADKEY